MRQFVFAQRSAVVCIPVINIYVCAAKCPCLYLGEGPEQQLHLAYVHLHPQIQRSSRVQSHVERHITVPRGLLPVITAPPPPPPAIQGIKAGRGISLDFLPAYLLARALSPVGRCSFCEPCGGGGAVTNALQEVTTSTDPAAQIP